MPSPELALRHRGGTDHHLFNNNGTWWVRYSIRDASWLKARRLGASLGTRNLEEARHRRDLFLAQLRGKAGDAATERCDGSRARVNAFNQAGTPSRPAGWGLDPTWAKSPVGRTRATNGTAGLAGLISAGR